MNAARTERGQRVLALVEVVPEGRVTTYGALARVADTGARQVAAIMANHPDTESVPWHRVLAAGGRIAAGPHTNRQIERLRGEGHQVSNYRLTRFSEAVYHFTEH